MRADGRNPQIYHLLSTPRGKEYIKKYLWTHEAIQIHNQAGLVHWKYPQE